jgi:hypothetical protein
MSIEKLLYGAVAVAPPLALVGGILSSFTSLVCAFGWFRSHRLLNSILKRIEDKENENFLQDFTNMNRWKVNSCFGLSNPQRFKTVLKNVQDDYSESHNPERTEKLMRCLQKRLIIKKRMDIVGVGGGIVNIVTAIIFFVTIGTPAYPIGYIAIGISLTLTIFQCGLNLYLTQQFWSEMNKIDPYYVPKESFFNKTFRWLNQGPRFVRVF